MLAQSYSHWELILVNDNSVDDSQSIILHYTSNYPIQIKSIDNSSNLGAGLSRNKGIMCATGTWLFFLDADDLLEVNCLAQLIDLAQGGKFDIIIANMFNLNNNLKQSNSLDLVTMFQASRYALSMYAWGNLYSMKFWNEYNFRFDNNYAEDLLLISQVLSKTNNIHVTNVPLYIYRSNPHSLTHTAHPYKAIEATLLKLLTFITNAETTAFVLSNSYNLIKKVASPFDRFKLYKKLGRKQPSF